MVIDVKKVILSVSITLILFLTSCSSVPTELQCDVDSDCVQNVCCHATGVVNKEYAPDCSDTLCSSECKPETLDCQQGEIKCIKNKCTAVLN